MLMILLSFNNNLFSFSFSLGKSLKMGAKTDTKKDAKGQAKVPKKKEGGSGKAKKKKWSKEKIRGKMNSLVLFDQATYDKLVNSSHTKSLAKE